MHEVAGDGQMHVAGEIEVVDAGPLEDSGLLRAYVRGEKEQPVVSVIAGLNQFVEEKIIQLAPDVYVVTKFGIIRSREEFLDALKRRDLDWGDYQVLSRTLQNAGAVAAQIQTSSAVKHLDRRLGDVQVQGTTSNFGPMAGLDIVAGRWAT